MKKTRAGKIKKVHYELIARDSVIGHGMYQLLDDLVAAHHEELRDARIALAWNTSWKPDVDGRLVLGKCKRASDLDRELAAFDFVILLLHGFWTHQGVTTLQRTALLDHELSHATLKLDERGEPVVDERGRNVYRTRKHDIEEFAAIVERYGTYTRDLEVFARAIKRDAARPFVPCDLCRETPGWVRVGDNTVRECECFKRQRALRLEVMAAAS